MSLTGCDEHCWKRLPMMGSEDIGPAEPHLPATVDALDRTYSDPK
jgi:hypothetical protein